MKAGTIGSPRRLLPDFGRRIVALLLLLGCGTHAVAQVLPLSSPGDGADWILDQEDLRGFEPLSLEDIVRHLVGVTVARRGAMGSLDFLNIAGSTSGRILLGLDGIDLGEPELAYPRLYAVPVAIVDRVFVSWSTDPARIEIWTRREEAPTSTTQIDLGRGDLTTRVRRLQFLLPPRAWWVGARYDELLRRQDDFRARPTSPPEEDLGAYDGRGRLLALGFERPNGERLRLLLADFFDNAHGSYADSTEITGSTRVFGSLRWSRPLARWGMVVDLSQQAWDRTRDFLEGTQQIHESHGSVGVDLTSPPDSTIHTALRLRAASVEGERQEESGRLEALFQRYDAEIQVGGRRGVAWNAWAGVHEHSVLGSDWSARLHLELRRAAWSLQAQGGRGISYAGWGEALPSADDGRRPSLYGSAGIRRDSEHVPLGVTAFAKRVEETGEATSLLFPLLGTGPRRIAGALADAGVHGARGRVHWGLEARLGWMPIVDGEPGGLPEGQADLLGRCAILNLFDGDLSITLRLRWRLETPRRFRNDLGLAAFSAGDARLDLRLLQRLLFYWDMQNLSDTAFEVHPGVLYPGRLSLIGVRVTLFD